jgi:cytochrome c oxidase subunit III
MHTVSSQPHTESHAPPKGDEPILEVQFDDLEQQHDSSMMGMWLFLSTEVLFFGGLITAYVVYRSTSVREFELASRHMAVWLGFLNTVILLGSSLTMAMAVRASQLRQHRELIMYLGLTMALGASFLGVKAVEYTEEFRERLFPGKNFGDKAVEYPEEHREHLVPGDYLRVHESDAEAFEQAAQDPDPRNRLNPGRYQMFFVLYFFMTGLHAIHLIIGIGLVGIMAYLSYHRWFSGGGATQIEVTGLYWHFIDIVWVFLYPLLYLINVHS